MPFIIMRMSPRVISLLTNKDKFANRCHGCHLKIELDQDYVGNTAGKRNTKRYCLKCADKYGIEVLA